jgi:hypothetical protein
VVIVIFLGVAAEAVAARGDPRPMARESHRQRQTMKV